MRRRRIPRPPLSAWGYVVRHKVMSALLGLIAALGLWGTLTDGNRVAALASVGRFDSAAAFCLAVSVAYLAIAVMAFACRVRVARRRRTEASARAPLAKPHMRPRSLTRKAQRLAYRLAMLRRYLRDEVPAPLLDQQKLLVERAMRDLPPEQALSVLSASGEQLRQLGGREGGKRRKGAVN